jgi:hypothetical protein
MNAKPRGPILLLMTSRRFRRSAGVTLLPVIYLGSFHLLLERKLAMPTGVDAKTGQNLFDCVPQYRIRERWVETAMRPALWIDRQIRADYWTTIEHSNGRKWKNP